MQVLIIVVVLFGVAWFLFIRPQKRRQLTQQEMLDSIEPGTEILTAGGLYATVQSIDGDELTVELAPGTHVRLARRAVAAVIPPEKPELLAEEEPEEDREREEVGAGSQSPGEPPS